MTHTSQKLNTAPLSTGDGSAKWQIARQSESTLPREGERERPDSPHGRTLKTVLGKSKRTQKDTQAVTPRLGNVLNRQITETERG